MSNFIKQLPQANTYLITLKDTSATSIERQAGLLMNQAAVSSVVQNASAIRLFDSVASSLNQTMTILVIVSVLLAIVILYNLTNINVAERIRELSTIKVLGFHSNEVTLYIYRETIVLSLVGIVLGLVSGFYLHQFLIQMISPATYSLLSAGRLGSLCNSSCSSKHHFDPTWFLCQSSSEKS